MLGGEQPVESNLHHNLIEHLNAEVVLHTITHLAVAMEWVTSSFLRIRARKNPRHYNIPVGLTPDQIDKKLLGKIFSKYFSFLYLCYLFFNVQKCAK